MEQSASSSPKTWSISSVGDRWNVAAVVAAIVFSAVMSLLPLASSSSVTADSDGTVVEESTRQSLLEREGASVAVATTLPALIAAIPMLGRTQRFKRRARIGASIVLAVAVVLGAASIGLFLLPVLVLTAVAAAKTAAPAEFDDIERRVRT